MKKVIYGFNNYDDDEVEIHHYKKIEYEYDGLIYSVYPPDDDAQYFDTLNEVKAFIDRYVAEHRS